MDTALILASVATAIGGVALVFAFFCAVRLNRLEWEVEQLKTEMQVGVSPFPIPFEPSGDPEQALEEYADRPAFLKRQAD